MYIVIGPVYIHHVSISFFTFKTCFSTLGVLLQWKTSWEVQPELTRSQINKRPQFRRSLFTVGLLLKHFDFTDPKVIEGLPVSIECLYILLLNKFISIRICNHL